MAKNVKRTGLNKASARSMLSGLQIPRMRAFGEMGVSGTSTYGGNLRQIERNPAWIGQQKYTTISDIVTNVSIVAASAHYFLNLVAHPQWSVKASDDKDKEAVELAEFVEEVLHDMATPWARIVRRAALFRFHGFGIQEWIAKKRDDGKIGLQDIEPRPQFSIERWEVAENGTVEGVWQRSPQTGQLLGIPRSKILYLVEDSLSDSPEGLGLFRHLGEPYARLKTYLALEARAFERDLRGTPIGRAPLTIINQAVANNEITRDEGDKLIQSMQDFVEMQVKASDTGMVLDSQTYEAIAQDGPKPTAIPQWDISLLTGTAAGLTELGAAIDRLQREMARIIGTEHLMMGDAGGNRALAADKSRNLYLVANAVLSQISEQADKDILEPLWQLNGFPEDKKPKLKAEDVAFKDVAQITAALQQMASAGAVLAPDDPAIDDVRDLLGVSKPEPMTPEKMQMYGMMPVPGHEIGPDGQPIPGTARQPQPFGLPPKPANENAGGPPKGVKPSAAAEKRQFEKWYREAKASGLTVEDMMLNLAGHQMVTKSTDPSYDRFQRWLSEQV